MDKQELTSLVAEILSQMNGTQPQVKSSDYTTVVYNEDRPREPAQPGGFVEDVSSLDLRKLYLVEIPLTKRLSAD